MATQKSPQTRPQKSPRLLTVDDLWQFERLGAPSLSPDGAQAVASLTRYSSGSSTRTTGS